MASELIELTEAVLANDDPRLCTCYGRGSVFRKEGRHFRVERGARTVVHRALCLVQQYGARCAVCPNGTIRVELTVTQQAWEEDE